MDQIMNYVKPELIVVAIVLYFLGMVLKESERVKDKYIPLLLCGVSVILCAIWGVATSTITNAQEAAMAIFTAITRRRACRQRSGLRMSALMWWEHAA